MRLKQKAFGVVAVLGVLSMGNLAEAAYSFGGYEYLVTANAYGPTVNWETAAQSEFGPTAHVVDWNTIRVEFGGSVASLRTFFDGIGYTAPTQGEGRGVTWNGDQIWSGTRSYGMNRAEGSVPGGFLVHDQIQNNWAILGSWPVDRQLVVRVPVPEPSQLALFPVGLFAIHAFRRIARSKIR